MAALGADPSEQLVEAVHPFSEARAAYTAHAEEASREVLARVGEGGEWSNSFNGIPLDAAMSPSTPSQRVFKSLLMSRLPTRRIIRMLAATSLSVLWSVGTHSVEVLDEFGGHTVLRVRSQTVDRHEPIDFVVLQACRFYQSSNAYLFTTSSFRHPDFPPQDGVRRVIAPACGILVSSLVAQSPKVISLVAQVDTGSSFSKPLNPLGMGTQRFTPAPVPPIPPAALVPQGTSVAFTEATAGSAADFDDSLTGMSPAPVSGSANGHSDPAPAASVRRGPVGMAALDLIGPSVASISPSASPLAYRDVGYFDTASGAWGGVDAGRDALPPPPLPAAVVRPPPALSPPHASDAGPSGAPSGGAAGSGQQPTAVAAAAFDEDTDVRERLLLTHFVSVTVEMQAKLHALEVGPASPTASPTASPSPSPYPSRVGGPGEGFGASGGSAAPPQPASSPVQSLGPAVAAHASPSDSASNVTSPQAALVQGVNNLTLSAALPTSPVDTPTLPFGFHSQGHGPGLGHVYGGQAPGASSVTYGFVGHHQLQHGSPSGHEDAASGGGSGGGGGGVGGGSSALDDVFGPAPNTITPTATGPKKKQRGERMRLPTVTGTGSGGPVAPELRRSPILSPRGLGQVPPMHEPETSPMGHGYSHVPYLHPGSYDVPPLPIPSAMHVDLLSPVGGMSSPHSVASSGSGTPRRSCARCGTTDTPKWRKDLQASADSPLYYCNACGLHMRKKSKPPGQARKPGGTAVHGSSAAYGSMPLPSPLATSGGFGGLLAPSISPAAPAAKRVPSKLSVNAVTGYDDPDGVFDPLPASSAHDTGSTASLPLDSFSALALGRKRGAEPPKQGQNLAVSYNTTSPRAGVGRSWAGAATAYYSPEAGDTIEGHGSSAPVLSSAGGYSYADPHGHAADASPVAHGYAGHAHSAGPSPHQHYAHATQQPQAAYAYAHTHAPADAPAQAPPAQAPPAQAPAVVHPHVPLLNDGGQAGGYAGNFRELDVFLEGDGEEGMLGWSFDDPVHGAVSPRAAFDPTAFQ